MWRSTTVRMCRAAGDLLRYEGERPAFIPPMGIFMVPRVAISVIVCDRIMEGYANIRTQPCTRTKVRGWT